MRKFISLLSVFLAMVFICSCASGEVTVDSTEASDTIQATEAEAAESTAPPESFVNIKDFQGGDGWNKALERAFEASDNVYFPKGKYRLETVYLKDNQTIFGDGDETVIEQMSDNLFWIDGKVTASSDLAVDMKDFSNEIETLARLNVKPGDVIYLLSQRNTNILEDCGYEW